MIVAIMLTVDRPFFKLAVCGDRHAYPVFIYLTVCISANDTTDAARQLMQPVTHHSSCNIVDLKGAVSREMIHFEGRKQ